MKERLRYSKRDAGEFSKEDIGKTVFLTLEAAIPNKPLTLEQLRESELKDRKLAERILPAGIWQIIA
jgi:hypothetical protein